MNRSTLLAKLEPTPVYPFTVTVLPVSKHLYRVGCDRCGSIGKARTAREAVAFCREHKLLQIPNHEPTRWR